MTEEYIEPTRWSRIGLLLVGLVAIGLAFLLFQFGPTFFEAPSTDSVCEALDHYRSMMQKGSLFIILPGLWLCFYASRILRSGQLPAPGAWVIHRAVIKTGPEVTQHGYFLLMLGLLITVSPTYFWSDISRSEKTSVELVCTD